MYFKLFILFCFLNLLTTANSCYEFHLSTKTPYRFVSNKNDSEMYYPGCLPMKIWSLIRHGTRNPSEKDIISCQKHLTKIRNKILLLQNNSLTPHEYALFRAWNCNLDVNEAKNLVYEGQDELIELGERMINRFPLLLLHKINPKNFKFKSTHTQRTIKSAENFIIGFLGSNYLQKVYFERTLDKDPILRFYKLCKRWQNNVTKNPKTFKEYEKFLKGKEMKNLEKIISEKTGINGLTADDIMLMYKFCGFETAWRKKRESPWCKLFPNNTIEIPEFAKDLEYYWVDGYGYDLTYEQACPAIKDMIEHIRTNSTQKDVTFYFTHSGTILKVLAHLGLYKDNFVLTHKDFNKVRNWKTSEIDPFTSNIFFVSYLCVDGPKVLVLHQERVVHLPGCPKDDDLCSFEIVEKIFEKSINNCKFDEICQNWK